jgi:uncharacterized membrane protein YhhN
MKSSWKTSVAGLGAILVAVGVAITAMVDNDPTTTPDWGIVFAAVLAGVGLFFARDNNISSESAGAK